MLGPEARVLSAPVPTIWTCASRIFSYSATWPDCLLLNQNFAWFFWSCPVCFLVCLTSSQHFVFLVSFCPRVLPHLSSPVLMSHLSCPSLSTFFPLVSYWPWEFVTLIYIVRDIGFRWHLINHDQSLHIKLTDDYCGELYQYRMTAYSLSCRFRHNAEVLYVSVRWHRTFSWTCNTFTFRCVRKIAKSDC